MDHLYILCVILCLVTTAVAFSEPDNVQWRTHMEERMEEMFRMIQKQNEVIEKQTNTTEKQSVEIELLRHRVNTLEGRTDNSETSNKKVLTWQREMTLLRCRSKKNFTVKV